MAPRRWVAAWLCAVCWLWLQPPAHAAATLHIDGSQAWPVALDNEVEWLEDPTTQLTVEAADTLTEDSPGGFLPGTAARMRPGFSRSAFWLRFTLVNDTGTVQPMRLVLDTTWLQHVDFHALRRRPGSDLEAWTHTVAGLGTPQEAPADRVPTLDLDLQPGESARVLVRVQSRSSVKLSPWLHTANSWRESESRHALLDGLLIGGLLVLAVYSLALWFQTRTFAMAAQSLGFALVALYEGTYRGHTHLALWPHSPEWSYRAAGVLAGCCVLSMVAYLYALTRRGPVRPPGLPTLAMLLAVQCAITIGTLVGTYAPYAQAGVLNALLLVLALTVSSFLYMRRAGPGGKLAFPVMLVVTVGVCLRLAELSLPARALPGLDAYVLGFPGLLVGLVALASWTHRLSHQRRQAKGTLLQWQAHEQQRLRDEVARKTHALNAALEQAEHHAREQNRLMACIGHDLRAPLATIVGHVRMLRSELGSRPEQLQAIERSAGYQLSLVDDLLEYAKGELMPFAFDPRPVRLPALIEDIAQYAAALAQRQNNRFALDRNGALPPVVSLDSKRFQQLLLNLLSNAAKFTRDGQMGLRVEAHAVSSSQWRLDIEVWDSGIGIAPEDQQRVFLAFERVGASTDGHGLGLAIARRIVTQMGGVLQLDSRRDLGTRLRFSVVVDAAPESAAPPLSETTLTPMPPPMPTFTEPRAQGWRRRPRPVAGIAPLPDAMRAELETLAREGRWTDLHEWADRLADDAHHAALVAAVRQALDALDFEHIRHLARATPGARG
ncbi:histidine kinase [Variovorax sp. KBW07]|uniref:sensor histidine kinase n=1 Tax=Variovorax sp. KBW07 TaxID=2153358 RepID=UPI000F57ACB8|nr:ATP-binding protein [Variovorax sp. KBW07]RQO63815.1 histidine kinase [Variovorax sp. KBW07]